MPEDKYDLEFITFSLGLIPICGGQAAVNVSGISCLEKLKNGGWRLTMDAEPGYDLTEADMVELERTIRARKEAAKALEKENYKQTLKAQAEAVNELNAGVAAGGVILGGKPGGRFRQQ